MCVVYIQITAISIRGNSNPFVSINGVTDEIVIVFVVENHKRFSTARKTLCKQCTCTGPSNMLDTQWKPL